VILDNLSANKTPAIRTWAAKHKDRLCLTPVSASWAKCDRGAIRAIARFRHRQLGPPDHAALARRLQAHLAWRNANARHPGILAAQRRERARIRSQRQQRWGRPRPATEAA
jgi:hypothetical protein